MEALKKTSSTKACWRWFALVGIAVLTGLSLSSARVEAQEIVEPTSKIEVGLPEIRTAADMETAEAAILASGGLSAPEETPFRSTMGEAAYQAAKAEADASTLSAVEGKSNTETLAPPTLIRRNFEGLNQTQSGGLRPPDTHGAVGRVHYCQIVNTRLRCYKKIPATPVIKDVSLAAFFGYTATTIFDPRIVYDATWNRWVIYAEAFPESATKQMIFIAVSKGLNPNSPYAVWKLDVNFFNNDDFWDYGQLGMDQDAVQLTANIFSPGFVGARMLSISKARLYNFQGWCSPIWSNLRGTLAPPIVLDQNRATYLVAAQPVDNKIYKYTLRDSSSGCGATLLGPTTIPVLAYTVPPDARQPGTTNLLDTLDSRFVNVSTQVGDSLFQVHTLGIGTFPIPSWYEIDTEGAGADTVKQSGTFFASNSSDDWNASVAANSKKDVFFTYSSTDTTTHAQVRVTGRRAADAAGATEAGVSCFTSPTFYNPSASTTERWGDYSAITIDPKNPLRGWAVNEKINSNTVWGSRICRVDFP